MKKNILYIGRFQPFHRGHADAIDQIVKKYFSKKSDTTSDVHLFIGIGSAEENFTKKNPLTAGERFEMIDLALKELGIPSDAYSILPVRNIDHYFLWPYHVQQFFPKIDVFVSGSPLVQMLWKKSFPKSEILELKARVKISATDIRTMYKNSPVFFEENNLLNSTQKFLLDINLSQRLRMQETSVLKTRF